MYTRFYNNYNYNPYGHPYFNSYYYPQSPYYGYSSINSINAFQSQIGSQSIINTGSMSGFAGQQIFNPVVIY